MFGRAEQIHLLEATFEGVIKGQPALVLIEGQAGAGKTALIEHFLSTCSVDTPHLLCASRCHDVGMGTRPLQPVVVAVGESVRRAADNDDPLVRRVLESRAFNTIAEVTAVMPWLNYASAGMKLAQIYFREDAPAPTEGGGEEDASRALLDFVLESASALPVILFLDDIHWADPHTLEWFADLIERCQQGSGAEDASPVKLMVIGTYRQLEGTRNAALESILARFHRTKLTDHLTTTSVVLGGLEEAASRELIQRTLRHPSFGPEGFTRWLIEYSGGVPLVIIDTLQALRDEGFFTLIEDRLMFTEPPARERGAWELGERLTAWLERDADKVERAITSSLAKLSHRTREVIDLASITQPHIYSRVLAEALKQDELEVMRHLELLCRVGFLRELPLHDAPLTQATATFAFVTQAHQGAVKGKISAHRQRLMHARVADVFTREVRELRARRDRLDASTGHHKSHAGAQQLSRRLRWRRRRVERAVDALTEQLLAHSIGAGEVFKAASILHEIASEWAARHIQVAHVHEGVRGALSHARLLELGEQMRALLAGADIEEHEVSPAQLFLLEGRLHLMFAQGWEGLDRHDFAAEELEQAYARGAWVNDGALLFEVLRDLCALHGDDNARGKREVRERILEHLALWTPAQFKELLEFGVDAHPELAARWIARVRDHLGIYEGGDDLTAVVDRFVHEREVSARLEGLLSTNPEEREAFLETISQLWSREDADTIRSVSRSLAIELGFFRELVVGMDGEDLFARVDEVAFDIEASLGRVSLFTALKDLDDNQGASAAMDIAPPLDEDLGIQLLASLTAERARLLALLPFAERVLEQRAHTIEDPVGLARAILAAKTLLDQTLSPDRLAARFIALLEARASGEGGAHVGEFVWCHGVAYLEMSSVSREVCARILAVMEEHPFHIDPDHTCLLRCYQLELMQRPTTIELGEVDAFVLERWPGLGPEAMAVVSKKLAEAWEGREIERKRAWLELSLEASTHDAEGLLSQRAILDQLEELVAHAEALDVRDVYARPGSGRGEEEAHLAQGIALIQDAVARWERGEVASALELLGGAYDAFSTPMGLGLIDDLCDHVIELHIDLILDLDLDEDDREEGEEQLAYHTRQISIAYETAARVCRQTEQWGRALEEYLEWLDFLIGDGQLTALDKTFREVLALAIELDSVAWCQHLGEWLEEQAIIWADEEDEETRALLEVLSLVLARREESLWRALSER